MRRRIPLLFPGQPWLTTNFRVVLRTVVEIRVEERAVVCVVVSISFIDDSQLRYAVTLMATDASSAFAPLGLYVITPARNHCRFSVSSINGPPRATEEKARGITTFHIDRLVRNIVCYSYPFLEPQHRFRLHSSMF